jgi:hypothetical protein
MAAHHVDHLRRAHLRLSSIRCFPPPVT